jgi:putative hemolysin
MLKKLIAFSFIMIALAACAGNLNQAGIPNPASLYCEEQGNTLEIRTAEDGSQSGLCVFPDGSVCDEWAYFQGECGISNIEVTANAGDDNTGGGNPSNSMPPGLEEKISGWWGVIKSTDLGAQYDDYFERQDLGQPINFGIGSKDPEVKAQIEALRDSGKVVYLYGTLVSNVPDYNGSQIQVDRIQVKN